MFTPIVVALAPALLWAQDVSPEQVAIEANLVPPVTFRGEDASHPGLEAQMGELGIPSISVAVFRNGELSWAEAYGEGVDSQTLYQAASLSKAVAAAGIIALAMDHGTSLDDDISSDLASLDLATINPEGLPITLRGLLSHTNGAGVSGFPGYPIDRDVPTTAQVIQGEAPANTDTVVLSSARAGRFNYSGGGYTIAQYWAETVTGEAFPALMRRYVLDPIGMERSLFATARQANFPRDNVASAHLLPDQPVAGGWHVYPEQAAAALWTTPTEYGLFVAALMDALEGGEDAGLPIAIAREMTTIVDGGYGLGIGVTDFDGALVLNHTGSNMGYKSSFMAFPDRGDLMVTMTGSEFGMAMLGDISRTATVAYNWPGPGLVERTRVAVTQAELDELIGGFAPVGSNVPLFTVSTNYPNLTSTLQSGQQATLARVGDDTWIDVSNGQEATFARNADGELTLRVLGLTFVRLAAD